MSSRRIAFVRSSVTVKSVLSLVRVQQYRSSKSLGMRARMRAATSSTCPKQGKQMNGGSVSEFIKRTAGSFTYLSTPGLLLVLRVATVINRPSPTSAVAKINALTAYEGVLRSLHQSLGRHCHVEKKTIYITRPTKANVALPSPSPSSYSCCQW